MFHWPGKIKIAHVVRTEGDVPLLFICYLPALKKLGSENKTRRCRSVLEDLGHFQGTPSFRGRPNLTRHISFGGYVRSAQARVRHRRNEFCSASRAFKHEYDELEVPNLRMKTIVLLDLRIKMIKVSLGRWYFQYCFLFRLESDNMRYNN